MVEDPSGFDSMWYSDAEEDGRARSASAPIARRGKQGGAQVVTDEMSDDGKLEACRLRGWPLGSIVVQEVGNMEASEGEGSVPASDISSPDDIAWSWWKRVSC